MSEDSWQDGYDEGNAVGWEDGFAAGRNEAESEMQERIDKLLQIINDIRDLASNA